MTIGSIIVICSYLSGAMAGLWYCRYRSRTYFYVQFGFVGTMTVSTAGGLFSMFLLLCYFGYLLWKKMWRVRVFFWLTYDCCYSPKYAWNYSKEFGYAGNHYTAREAVRINESHSRDVKL